MTCEAIPKEKRDELLQTPEVRARADYIPWPKIIGMCNVLVHGYFDIDTDIVWLAVTRDVPELKPQVRRLLNEINH